MVGTFYPPALVLVDPLFLRTLPERQLHAGLAEVLKCGLIGDRAFWDRTSGAVRRLIRGLDPEYPAFIAQAIAQKLTYVERDEFERAFGVRELLNLGHTFGHALEAATGFSVFLHGEAVIHGMRTAVWLSSRLGYLGDEERHQIDNVLRQVPVKASAELSPEKLIEHLRNDKKRAGANRFVLLRAIGEAFVENVEEAMVLPALEYLTTLARNENTGS
jgi:3-dehydroquinate synthase